jgi:hypothetical protein
MRVWAGILLAALVAGQSQVLAQSRAAIPASAATPAATSLRAADLRVAAVAFRVAIAGAPLCPQSYPVTGLLLHHLPEYDKAGRQIQIDRYGLDRGPGVLATVAGSPAARAGLTAGDVLLSVNGQAFPDPRAMASEPKREVWRKMVEASERKLEDALRQGPARLKILRAGTEQNVSLSAVPGCPARVRLAYSNQADAFSNSGYAIVTTRILAFVESDDELAFVIGHELAHVILDHEARLKDQRVPRGVLRGIGRNASRVRFVEEEADRLGLRLVTAAGYDLSAAIPFWRRFHARFPKGPQLFRTHPGLAARERIVREEMAAARRSAQ